MIKFRLNKLGSPLGVMGVALCIFGLVALASSVFFFQSPGQPLYSSTSFSAQHSRGLLSQFIFALFAVALVDWIEKRTYRPLVAKFGENRAPWLTALITLTTLGGLIAACVVIVMRVGPSHFEEVLLTQLQIAIWVIVAGWLGLLPLAVRRWRAIRRQMIAGPTYRLVWQKSESPPDEWLPVWSDLIAALPTGEYLAFEIFSDNEGMACTLHASAGGMQALRSQIEAEKPSLRLYSVEEKDPAILPTGWHGYWCECVLTNARSVELLGRDPIDNLAGRLNRVRRHLDKMRGLVQFIVEDGRYRKFSRSANDHVPVLQVTIRCIGMSESETPAMAETIARDLAWAVCASFSHRNPLDIRGEGTDMSRVTHRRHGHRSFWTSNELSQLAFCREEKETII